MVRVHEGLRERSQTPRPPSASSQQKSVDPTRPVCIWPHRHKHSVVITITLSMTL